jgi:hypothetical protein
MQSENKLKKSYDDGWNEVSSFINYTNTLINDIEEMYNKDGFLSYKNTLYSNGLAHLISSLILGAPPPIG